MSIFILIDVQYSQKAVFSFQKGMNRQNHISSGFLHLVKNPPHQNFWFPPPPKLSTPTPYCYLENPGDGAKYLFKILNFGSNS